MEINKDEYRILIEQKFQQIVDIAYDGKGVSHLYRGGYSNISVYINEVVNRINQLKELCEQVERYVVGLDELHKKEEQLAREQVRIDEV